MLPLVSSRLLLRRFAIGDAPAFAAYRSDPAVARYQDWESCTLVEAEAFTPGSPVLLFGFGGGLAYAGQVVRTPAPSAR